MSQLFNIEISGDLVAAIPRIKDQVRYARAMAVEMDFQNELTIRVIMQSHLSGPTTDSSLSARTSRLLKSVTRSNAVILGTGVISSIGSNVVYAKVHEEGFDGDVRVKSYLRRVKSRDQYAKVMVGGKIKRIRTVTGRGVVNGFTRHMHIIARAPFGHGIADRLPDYTAAFEKVTEKFLKGQI
jgi:hypothetical protein